MTRPPRACAELLALLALALPARADETPSIPVPSAAAPAVDGMLGEEEWAAAEPFEVPFRDKRGGRGMLLRSGRQLYFGYTSDLSAFALGMRLVFVDPDSRRRVLVQFAPLNPPSSPLSVYREDEKGEQEPKSARTCEARFTFERGSAFTIEARVPLDLLEIGRRTKVYGFTLELWDLAEKRPVAAFPVAGADAGPFSLPRPADLSPEGDWGADVEEAEPAEDPALALLEDLARDRPGEGLLAPYLGSGDGRRRDAPLADMQARLEELAAARPDYASLRAHLLRTLVGRNRVEEALAVVEGMAEDFPPLRGNYRQAMLHVRLLRDLGRFQEALELFVESADLLRSRPEGVHEFTVLLSLRDAWRAELRMREEEAGALLPRVKLETGKGDVVIELFEDDAPNAVANFVSLVESGFYDGTRFHWCEGGSRVAGGDPNSRDDDPYNDGFGGPGYAIESEPGRRLNLPYHVVLVDKRRTRREEGSLFGIHIAPMPSLDGVNSVIGRVVEGEDVVRALEYGDVLAEATVVRKRDHEYAPVKR